MIIHLGLDDTDSPEGGCTTYVAAKLTERLLGKGAVFIDYPCLIRLNPNTPWKTRGNASVCLRFNIDEPQFSRVQEEAVDLIEEYGEFRCENTNPGLVIHRGAVPPDLKDFSRNTEQRIVELEEANRLIKQHEIQAVGWKNRRGLIGALAAVGGTLEADYTYELITYRAPENWGTSRRVDPESIREMDAALGGEMFNNVDESGKPLITPRGPDPVLYGVRGESADAVYRAFRLIREEEPVERWMIYRSNQGTDSHFSEPVTISMLNPHHPAVVQGVVSSIPAYMVGGHLFFRVRDGTGEVDCAAYEPTGSFRHRAEKLIPGDAVTIYGGVRPYKERLTLNVEKLEVTRLALKTALVNPSCPLCGGRMESMGKNQGYRCKKCRHRDSEASKTQVTEQRRLETGVYLPDRNAHRHLTKPLERYGREKTGSPEPLSEPWAGWTSPGS